jgi:hypothetical protein
MQVRLEELMKRNAPNSCEVHVSKLRKFLHKVCSVKKYL